MSWRGSAPATCWAANEAAKVIPTEAETPSDAVFLATHSSIPVFKRDVVTNAKRTTKTDEHAVLSALLEQPADQPILPILGGSGTGKSHLVRWLRAKLPESESRRVIFVPKHRMSLRGVLELILEHATGERADEFRQKVAAAAEAMTDEHTAKLRLRNELAVLVETRGMLTDASPEEADLRTYLASSDGLPALMTDPVFRDRLLDSNGPMAKLVREKLKGKGTDDKDEAFGFKADDLRMSLDDVSRASTAAVEVSGALADPDPHLRELAARMLNEQLGPAVSQVFGIGGEDLKNLLVEVRSELRQQDLELLLLIEDFSIFQGIQGGLLDAITLIPTQDNDICPMRVVMAVTTGYFVNQMPDTVYTRVYKVFDLDDPDPQVSFAPAKVAARYMNAIRVGGQRLEEVERGDETPNACEQCPVNDQCHKAFGSADGYGLFPFNENALNKAVKSKLVDERLSVRDLLTRVLRPVLFNDHDEIEQGTFPNAQFDAAFRAGAVGTLDSVEDEHKLATPGDRDISKRRVILVRYWGSEGAEPHNLHKTIHEAFSIPEVEGLRGEATPKGAAGSTQQSAPSPNQSIPTPATPATPATKNKTEEPALVQAIDKWRATGQLIQSQRKELRNIVHAAVAARLSFDDGLGGSSGWTPQGRKQWDVVFDSQTSIALGDPQMAGTIIAITPDNDEDVRALRALAWVDTTANWRSVKDGEMLQRLAEEKVSAWALAVSNALFSYRDERDDPELAVAARTLLSMSKALGIPDAFKDDALSRTRALFSASPLGPDVSRPKLRQWQMAMSEDSQKLTRAQLQERVLRLGSFTQAAGRGRPLALDLPRVMKALRGQDSGSDTAPSTGLLEATAKSVRARHNALPDVRDEASTVVPDLSGLGGELPEIIKRLETLITERASAGQLPGVINRSELISAGKAIKPGDQKRIEGVRDKIDDWDQLQIDDRIRLLTDDWDEPARRVRQWFDLATHAIRALEDKLGKGTDSAAQVEYSQTHLALMSTLRETTKFLESALDAKETA